MSERFLHICMLNSWTLIPYSKEAWGGICRSFEIAWIEFIMFLDAFFSFQFKIGISAHLYLMCIRIFTQTWNRCLNSWCGFLYWISDGVNPIWFSWEHFWRRGKQIMPCRYTLCLSVAHIAAVTDHRMLQSRQIGCNSSRNFHTIY